MELNISNSKNVQFSCEEEDDSDEESDYGINLRKESLAPKQYFKLIDGS